MPKLSITKMTAEGEQIGVEIEYPEFSSLVEAEAKNVLDFVDRRMLEMNLRIVKAQTLNKGLTPEAQGAVHEIIEVLHGRVAGSKFGTINANDVNNIVNAVVDVLTEREQKPVINLPDESPLPDPADTESVQKVIDRVKSSVVPFKRKDK